MIVEETVRVVVTVERALMASSISCPACGLFCRCTGYIPGEVAAFECRACAVRYWIRLGTHPVLRAEALD